MLTTATAMIHVIQGAIFSRLPRELLTKILEELDLDSALRVYETCKSFHTLIDSSAFIPLKIHLAKHGYSPGPARPLGQSDKLPSFIAHNNAWQQLTYRRLDTFPILSDSPIWDLFGGVFAQGQHTNGNVERVRKLVFTELPSVIRNEDAKEWKFEDVGVDVRDFRIVPERDLMALIEMVPTTEENSHSKVQVHLRTLYTNTVHPSTTSHRGVLTHTPFTAQPRGWSFTIEINGDILGLLFHPRDAESQCEEELVVWDWARGVKLCVLSSTSQRYIGSFTILSPEQMLVCAATPRPASASLDIYDFQRTQPATQSAFALNADLSAFIHPPLPTLLYSFLFPPLQHYVEVLDISIRSDPPASLSPPGNVPFYPDPHARTFVVMMTVVSFHEDDHDMIGGVLTPRAYQYTFFTRLAHLMNHALAVASPSPITIPWKTWGPRSTRLFTDRINRSQWVCYVFGDRFLAVRPNRRVCILDFSPCANRMRREDRLGPTLMEESILRQPPETAVVLPLPIPSSGLGNVPGVHGVRPAAASRIISETFGPTNSSTVFAPESEDDTEATLDTFLPYRIITSGWRVPDGCHVMIDAERILIVMQVVTAEGIHHGHEHQTARQIVCLTF